MFSKESHIHIAPLASLNDEELIRKFVKENDRAAMGVVYERYTLLVFGVCRKYMRDTEVARELSMQIFEQLLTDLPRYEIENFRPWLHTLVRNKCLMELRKKNFTEDINDEKFLETGVMESDAQLHHTLEGEQRLTRMEELLEQLVPEQSKCVKLFYLEEKTYAEVASVTGYSLLQVKSYIQNGKRNLKNLMIASGEFELLLWLLMYAGMNHIL